MTPAHILFVANNPGGLRALLPVIPHCSASRLWIPAGLRPLVPTARIDIQEIDPEASADVLHAQLVAVRPNTLVTGTSVVTAHGGDLENRLRCAARALDIPSVAVLDHWCNYSARFTTRGGTLRDALPDRICIMDTRARDEMLADGFPPESLCVTGHPGFDALVSLSTTERHARRSDVRQQLGVQSAARLVGLLTEPVATDYGTGRGYDEREVVGDCLQACATLSCPVTLLLKTHPREAPEKYRDLLSSAPLHSLAASPTLSGHDAALACDLVIGMTTVLLLEAMLLHCASLSYQPRLDPTAPEARVIQPVPLVTDRAGLATALQTMLGDERAIDRTITHFYTEQNATQKVIVAVAGVSGNARVLGRTAGTGPRTGRLSNGSRVG